MWSTSERLVVDILTIGAIQVRFLSFLLLQLTRFKNLCICLLMIFHWVHPTEPKRHGQLYFQSSAQRVTYQLATVCYKARSTSTPAYLQSLLVPHVPLDHCGQATHRDWPFLELGTVFASRAFSVAAPAVCNSLPDNVVNSDTLVTFKKRLKTHLFRCVMWNVLATERLCSSYYGAIQVLSLHCIVYVAWNKLNWI